MNKMMAVSCLLVLGGLFYAGCDKTKDETSLELQGESTGQSEKSTANLLILPGICVGDVRLGMTVDEMKDVLGKPDVAATGISFMYKSLGIEVVANDKKTVIAISCGNPHNINTPIVKALGAACKFKTAEGIGIGSTADHILQEYGEPSRKSNDGLLYKDDGIAFFLSDDKVIGIWLQK